MLAAFLDVRKSYNNIQSWPPTQLEGVGDYLPRAVLSSGMLTWPPHSYSTGLCLKWGACPLKWLALGLWSKTTSVQYGNVRPITPLSIPHHTAKNARSSTFPQSAGWTNKCNLLRPVSEWSGANIICLKTAIGVETMSITLHLLNVPVEIPVFIEIVFCAYHLLHSLLRSD